MIRIPGSLVGVGCRFRFDVFDDCGLLILMRGSPVTSEAMASMIRTKGLRRPPKSRSASPFSAISSIADRLTVMEEDILEQRDNGVWSKRIHNLVKDFIDVSDTDPDAAFANIHLENRHSYFVVHSMMAALVCARLALARSFDPSRRYSLVAAALTHDFGIIGIQKVIGLQNALTAEHQALVRKHGKESVRTLRGFGIDDPDWLQAIEDHHEYLDGTGYAGKKGREISDAARILAIADSYSAMLRPRPYRERIYASQALEILYGEEYERYDRSILEALLWDLGFYPPGSLVRLASREMALAVRNTPGLLDSPLVAVLTDPDGHPLLEPVLRDAQNPEFAIVEALDPSQAARVGKVIEQCWVVPGAQLR